VRRATGTIRKDACSTSQLRRNRRRPDRAAVKRALILWDSEVRAPARLGLVYGPYLNAESRTSIATAIGGACTKLRRRFAKPQHRHVYPLRGEIREFSRRSRTRLQQTLCSVPVAHVGRGLLFVTLTYPGQYAGDWQTWKRQLNTMHMRLKREFPAFAAVWKLEPQRRGAPHFHLLVVGLPFLAKDWLSRAWYEVVDSGDERHLRAGTQVQLARSHRGVVSYAAKYTAKREALPESWQGGVGRWWGVFERAKLGIIWRWAPLTEPQYYAAVRVVRALVRHRLQRRSRPPPRPSHSGTWAVLPDWQAQRLLSCVRRNEDTLPPEVRRAGRRHQGESSGCPVCLRPDGQPAATSWYDASPRASLPAPVAHW